MTKNVVLIEDELDILESLKFVLEKNGYTVSPYQSAEAYFNDQKLSGHSVYLIDWNLPGIKGVDIVRTIRQKDKISPIFIISGNNRDDQIVEGLKSGADDYIKKPFNYDELIVRVGNAYSKMSLLEESLINVGLKLIPEADSIIKDGVTVSLTSREYIIFDYLFKHSTKPVTREELIQQFDKDMEMTSRNIDVHVFSLRKKISKLNLGVETVWGTGYKISL